MENLKERVKAAILAEPHKANMDAWARSPGQFGIVRPGPLSCGTTLCIAGHIAHAAGAAVFVNGLVGGLNVDRPRSIAGFAAETAGLSHERADELFCTYNWDKDLRDNYIDAVSAADRADVMCQAIDRYWLVQDA